MYIYIYIIFDLFVWFIELILSLYCILLQFMYSWSPAWGKILAHSLSPALQQNVCVWRIHHWLPALKYVLSGSLIVSFLLLLHVHIIHVIFKSESLNIFLWQRNLGRLVLHSTDNRGILVRTNALDKSTLQLFNL